MIPLTLDEVAELCPGRLDRAPWADEVTGVQIDSRRIEEGDLFVEVGGGEGLRAARVRARARRRRWRRTMRSRRSARSAREIRDASSARVVAITGSTGKTSTKDILAAMCRPHAKTVAAEGGHNNEIGLPLTLTRIEPDTEVVVCEMGMRGLGQIAELCAIARPDVGVITSIGPVHLELLGTIENVARRRRRSSRRCPRAASAIVPDEPLLEPFLGRDDIRSTGSAGRRGVVRADRRRQPGRLRARRRAARARVPFTARHQAQNAVAALLAVQALGLPLPRGRGRTSSCRAGAARSRRSRAAAC